jgi:Rrf2 family protein
MKLGTRTRHSARAMLDLALNYENGCEVVPSSEISTCQQVSPKHLEHLLGPLRSAGLARSVWGASGGYTLTRPPDQINLCEIYHASMRGP